MCREPSDEKYYEVDLMTPIQSLSSTKLRVIDTFFLTKTVYFVCYFIQIKRKEWADTPRVV